MMFAISALNRLETQVHQLVLLLAGVLAVMSMASFLYLIDYAARLLRPISILTRVTETGLTVIEALYSEPTRPPDTPAPASPPLGAPDRRARGIIAGPAHCRVARLDRGSACSRRHRGGDPCRR